MNNSGGAFFVILLAPLVGDFWLWLNKRGKEPDTLVKFGLGFILLRLGYWVLKFSPFFSDAQRMISLKVFTLAMLVISLGELCLSPIGLSIMTKLSTEKLQGVMMGMWFLASAYGQYIARIIGAGMAEAKKNALPMEELKIYTDGYGELGIYAITAGCILILVSPFVRKLMGEVK